MRWGGTENGINQKGESRGEGSPTAFWCNSLRNHCGVSMSVTSTEVNIQPTHKCSFCGKTNVEVVGVLVAGPGVSICQKYVFQCVDIVFKYAEKTNDPTH
ncbi:ClpX C4-type zinc finger protein [Salmonella enterica subsp. enterica serovar Chicago]